LKVGFLTTAYPRFPEDPRGEFVKRLADELGKRGVRVEVIEPAGFDVLKRGAGFLPNLSTSLRARLAFPFYCARFQVLALVRSGGCDLLHANWSLTGWFAVVAGRVRRRKVLLTERSPFLIETNNRMVNGFVRLVIRSCDLVVTLSGQARENLARKFPEIDIRVVPNGVDEQLFSPSRRASLKRELGLGPDVQHLLSVGRLTPIKRVDVLFAALRRCAAEGARFHCWVIGDGELADELGSSVAGDGVLKDRVTFLGRKSHQEVARWMCAADVSVSCSEGETGGNTVLEAMSAGMTVITTPVGWANDYVQDGVNGVIVPAGDIDVLADRIGSLLRDPASMRSLGDRARRTIEERGLTWGSCADSYLALYREVLSGGGK